MQAAFRHSNALYRGFCGGRSAGKSWVGAYDLLRRCRPGRTYLVASPTGVLMGDTTYPTLVKLAHQLGIWRGVKLTPYPNVKIACGRGRPRATIRMRTAEDPERLRGPNLSGVWLDEASLMHVEAFHINIAALREEGEQGWLSATFTPKGYAHWTYETFGKRQPDTECFHARTADNPFNPPAFQETLVRQYGEGSALVRQELLGEFMDDDAAWQIIPTAWVQAAMDRWKLNGNEDKPLDALGVDVARGGADKTVLAPRHRTWFGPLAKHPGKATPDGAAVIGLVMQAIATNPKALVCIDVIGVGSSPYDWGKAVGVQSLFPVDFREGTDLRDASGTFGFANLRAFAWWSMRDALDPASGLNVCLPPDPELLADLTAPRWRMTLRGVQVELKEEVVKRIGRSPDCGDAVVLAALLPPQ